MGCTYTLDFTQCYADPEEDNYADYVDLDSTRLAAHVGDIRYQAVNLSSARHLFSLET